ncbi:hypothetical protein Hanom_Chr15g01384431 [Helianthus anomalus]
MVATTNTAPATKTPFRNVSHEKLSVIFLYVVWYAFFFAPAIRQASATRNVSLHNTNNKVEKFLLSFLIFITRGVSFFKKCLTFAAKKKSTVNFLKNKITVMIVLF